MISVAHILADARHKATQTVQAADACQRELEVLEDRLAEAQARHAAAREALRTGRLDEPTAAARMSVASADAVDLQPLIDDARRRATESYQTYVHAGQAVREAEAALARQQRQLDYDALGDQIRRLEEKLLAALAERYRLGGEVAGRRGGSLFNYWQPSEALRRAITEMTPPEIRGG
ncbi:hypothetical protein [Paraburkholderia sp. A1RO-5L]|uniref:hypothetical protein n=1 Tax=unclassified Paraburkholderia TaxID=2615204 RepID=UPI003B80DA9C